MLRALWVAVGIAGLTLGCGSDGAGSPAGASGSSGANAGGAAGASGGAGANAGGAAGASGAAGVGGSAITNGGACSGVALSHVSTVLTGPATADLSNPTLTDDELEMYYAVGLPAGAQDAWTIHRATRATKTDPFTAGDAQPELDAACPGTNRRDIALSSDGLSLYIMCEAPDADLVFSGPLRRARRPSRGAAWTLEAPNFGPIGWSPTLTGDELTLVSSSTLGNPASPMLFTRATRDAAFGAGSTLTSLSLINSPDVSVDGKLVFGMIFTKLVLFARPDSGDDFTLLNADLLQQNPLPVALGSPAHSADCSTLYYIQVDGPATARIWTIRAAQP